MLQGIEVSFVARSSIQPAGPSRDDALEADERVHFQDLAGQHSASRVLLVVRVFRWWLQPAGQLHT
jgi:hypothetical protein